MKNTQKKIIITDTNILSDLYTCNLIKSFISLDFVYVCSLVKNKEVNEKTTSLEDIKFMKVIEESSEEIETVIEIQNSTKGLSLCDLINYVIAKRRGFILATGDKKLRKFSKDNGAEVIGVIGIINMLNDFDIINNEQKLSALKLLQNNPKSRLPKDNISQEIKSLEKLG